MTASAWARRVLFPFALTRAGLLLVGILALGLMGSVRDRMPGNLVAHAPGPLPMEIWARWDSEWYLLIAEKGYDAPQDLERYGAQYHPEDTAGFFPLYPLLIRCVARAGVSPLAAALLLSNLALLAAVTLLYEVVRDRCGAGIAGGAVWALLCFPTSLFLSAAYSESLSLALTLGAFWAARRARWGWLAAAGFLCALSRPTGLLVMLPIAWEVGEMRGGWGGWASLASFPAGTAAFSLFCLKTFGDPLAWMHRQERWRGAISGPWRAFQRFAQQPPQLHGAHNSLLELSFALVFLAALPTMMRRFPRSWATHALITILVPLGSTLWSFGRISLSTFPAFALAGKAFDNRTGLLNAYLSVALPLGGLLMSLFACGWWAG
jgi:hypothetical protein